MIAEAAMLVEVERRRRLKCPQCEKVGRLDIVTKELERVAGRHRRRASEPRRRRLSCARSANQTVLGTRRKQTSVRMRHAGRSERRQRNSTDAMNQLHAIRWEKVRMPVGRHRVVLRKQTQQLKRIRPITTNIVIYLLLCFVVLVWFVCFFLDFR